MFSKLFILFLKEFLLMSMLDNFIEADTDVLEAVGYDADMDNMEDVRLDNELEESQDMSLLERAKTEGLKITEDGRIVLPSSKKHKTSTLAVSKKEPKVKVKTAPVPKPVPEPKAYKGIKSNIFSTGNTLNNIIESLNCIKTTVDELNINCPYKISTYKNELRLTFDTLKGSTILDAMPPDLRTNCAFTTNDKEYLLMKIN
jgi:hypothetical protein